MEEKFQNLTFSKATIIGVVILGFYWATFYNDGSANVAQIKKVESQVNKKQTELNGVKKAIKDAARFSVIVTQLGEQMNKITQALPEKFSGIDLMKLLSTEAKIVGANILSVSEEGSASSRRGYRNRKKTEDKDKSFFEEVTVQVSLECTFTQMMMYLSNLTQVDKIITLKSLNLKTANSSGKLSEEGSPMLSFTAKISAYRYLGGQK